MNISSEQELKKAIDILNKAGKSDTLFLTNDITLSSSYVITAPISLNGNFFKIKYSNNATLSWQGKTKGWYDLQTTELGEIIKTDAPLSVGDYVICQSNDKINIDPHSSGGIQHPHEIHLINSVKPKMAGVESFVVDKMSGNLSILNPLENICVSNLVAEYEGKQDDYCTALKFDGVSNTTLSNIHFKKNGPGAIWFNNAYNTSINQCRLDGTLANDNVYAITVGTVNNFFISGCLITGSRHAFTTTAAISKGAERWGTPLNVIMNNCVINVPTKDDNTTRVGLDTHAEGYGILFKNCTINIGGGNCNYGANARSRKTVFSGCTFNGSGVSKGVEIYGENCQIDNCTFNKCWIGISTKKFRNDYANNLSIHNCIFNDNSGPPIYLEFGKNHLVTNPIFNNVMFNPSSKFKSQPPIIGTYRTK